MDVNNAPNNQPVDDGPRNDPQRPIIVLTSCTLHPPSAPFPPRRERPNGCRTVFAGCLPEKMTEEIVREVFSECGEIVTVRMTRKNFCHVRFASEHQVDRALLFNGYRIKILNKDEPAYSSRMAVDYAVFRDDQYEYEASRRRKLAWEPNLLF